MCILVLAFVRSAPHADSPAPAPAAVVAPDGALVVVALAGIFNRDVTAEVWFGGKGVIHQTGLSGQGGSLPHNNASRRAMKVWTHQCDK